MSPTAARPTGPTPRLQLDHPAPPHPAPHRPAVLRQALLRPALLSAGKVPYLLSGALAVIAGLSATFSLFYPSLLGGTEVAKGNLRGTALVVLVIGVPALLAAMARAARGSARALVLWLAAAAYLLYQSVLFCFATPLNNLFLLYVAHLGLALWTLTALLRHTRITGFAARIGAGMPMRWIAGITGTLAVLNALVWLARIVPVVFTSEPSSVLDGSGLLTSPVWVQDLAFWIPAMVVGAGWMWRRRPWGVLLTGAMLAFYVAECLSIASDQWWGARADPSLPQLASMAAVPPFMVAAFVLALPLLWYLRHLDGRARAPELAR
jgi:hypothetical protein